MGYPKKVAAVFDLPLKQHAKLASELIRSLDIGEPDEKNVGRAWASEIQQRVEEIRRGEVKMITLEELKRDIRAPRKRRR